MMQRNFLIERLCPEVAAIQLKRYPQLRDLRLPLLVLVKSEPEPNLNHPCSAQLVYQVDAQRAEKVRKEYGLLLNPEATRFVCEHMGKVIQ